MTVLQRGARVPISPYARKIAAATGVNLDDVIGTGPGGRIVCRDVISAEKVPPCPSVTTLASLPHDRTGSSLTATADLTGLLGALSVDTLPSIVRAAADRLSIPLTLHFLPPGILEFLPALQDGEPAAFSIASPVGGIAKLSLAYSPSALTNEAAQALLLNLRASLENPLSLLL